MQVCDTDLLFVVLRAVRGTPSTFLLDVSGGTASGSVLVLLLDGQNIIHCDIFRTSIFMVLSLNVALD